MKAMFLEMKLLAGDLHRRLKRVLGSSVFTCEEILRQKSVSAFEVY